jgi:hypothetical protein
MIREITWFISKNAKWDDACRVTVGYILRGCLDIGLMLIWATGSHITYMVRIAN